jgi:hypothetical protein
MLNYLYFANLFLGSWVHCLFGYLPDTYMLQLHSLFFLSFWRKEAGIHIKDRCSTLLFFYQYSSAYGKPTSKGLVCFARSGFHVTDSCLLVTLTEWDGWFQYFMPLPKRSREVVFTSSTVTSVAPYRMIWMITNQSRRALVERYLYFDVYIFIYLFTNQNCSNWKCISILLYLLY